MIWDLAEEDIAPEDNADVEALKHRTLNYVIPELETYKKELQQERMRQTSIKEKYGLRSLNHLVVKLDGDLIALYDRKEQGENVDLVIRNKEGQKKKYARALEELKAHIRKERSLTMGMPSFVGIIRVRPSDAVGKAMHSDAEIERLGMETATNYEIEHGRIPEDVSAENLGFDIRSTDESGKVRYIEVKARAQTGAVALTQNEWFKAKRFGEEYYLYAVMNAAGKPQLYTIQNPAERLEPKEQIGVVRYVISLNAIKVKGVKTDDN